MDIDLVIIKGNLRLMNRRFAYEKDMLKLCWTSAKITADFPMSIVVTYVNVSIRASFVQTVINFNSSNVNVLVISFLVNFVRLLPLSLVFFTLIIPCIAPLNNSQYFHFNFRAICYSSHLYLFSSNNFIHCFQELACIHAHHQSHLWKNCLWTV